MSARSSLKKLRLSAVDLLLSHWPNPNVPLKDSIGALCRAKRSGLAKHIGVANFTVPLVEEAVGLTSEPLVTNQIEVHSYLDQSRVIAACRRHGLSVTAYCPLARGKVPADRALIGLGKARSKSTSQVVLRFLIQQGLIVIPRTSKRERLAENLAIFDFSLSETAVTEVAGLRRPDGRVVNPPHAPKWDT